MTLAEQLNDVFKNSNSTINPQNCKNYENAYTLFQSLVQKGLVSKRGNCLLSLEYKGINTFNRTIDKQ